MAPAPYPWARLRAARYDHVYVSPHMDDAVYSCGGQIAKARAEGAHVLVVNVFGTGASQQAGDVARARGEGATSESAGAVFRDMVQRKREEQAAMDRLDLDFVWLDYPEALYRPKRLGALGRYALSYAALAPAAGDLAARIAASLAALATRLLAPAGLLHFPLGIGFHPDHRLLHEIGRALTPASAPRCFYEDVPYAQVESLRRDRLRYLGHPAMPPTPLASSTRAIDRLVFPHAAAWKRPVTRLFVGGHLAGVRALFALAHRAPDLGTAPRLVEHDIGAVLPDKLAAMRAYESQTAHFFPDPNAIADALRSADGRWLERSWIFADAPAPSLAVPPAYLAAEQARLDALLASSQR